MSAPAMAPDEGDDAAVLQQEFTARLRRCFDELRSRGMAPNEACALGLKVAAGVVQLPPRVEELLARLKEAPNTPQPDLAAAVMQYLASPDAMFASFWPRQPTAAASSSSSDGAPRPTPAHAAAGAGGMSSSSSSSASDPQPPDGPAQPASWDAARPADRSARRPASDSASTSGRPCAAALDLDALHALHQAIQSCRAPGVAHAAVEGACKLMNHVGNTSGRNLHNPGLQQQLASLLLNPLLEDPEHHHAVARLCYTLVHLPALAKQELQQLLLSWRTRDMRVLLITLQQYITFTLYSQRQLTAPVECATQLMGMLSAANDATGVLEHAEFYNDTVNNEDFNVKEDFRRWKVGGHAGFSFCDFSFVYDPASKARIMQLENACTQYAEFETSFLQAILGGGGTLKPYFLLRVRRGQHLLSDTLLQVNHAKEDGSLRKPLKVKFIGEEGVDEGGVQKEFFQLLVRQCFNPDFGMFTYDDRRHLHWFRASQMYELDNEYELIGILIGLAIYNSHILEFQFPMVLYRKLLDVPLDLSDLAELHPEVHQSLTKLLQMTPGEVDGLELNFTVDAEVDVDVVKSVELLPGGAALAVTVDNRQQYVRLYSQHLLEGSIQRQFAAFKRGFHRLCSGAALQMFRPDELEALVCGGRVLDMAALQGATQYEDGYTANHPVIQWFWEVVHGLSEHQKKRLLFFITGSDRVPIKGLAHISPPFVISRNGPHSERLPTAHTCFNHLLLPAYQDRDALHARLLLAIENAEGFGLS